MPGPPLPAAGARSQAFATAVTPWVASSAAGAWWFVSAAAPVLIFKVKTLAKSRASGGSSGVGLSPGRGRPVLLWGCGPACGCVRCFVCRRASLLGLRFGLPVASSPLRVSHRPGGVKSGPSRVFLGRRFWRPDLTPPGRHDLQASPTRREAQTRRTMRKQHQGCGARPRRRGGSRSGRGTRHQGCGG